VFFSKHSNWYDYGAQFYDPQIGRFHTQDRFSEKYQSWTPYQCGGNNPIAFIDINGDSIWNVNPRGYVTHSGIGARDYAGTHTLHAVNAKGEQTGASIAVKDGGILDGLATERPDFTVNIYPAGEKQGSYGETTNTVDGRQVFKFGADNTDVEWGYQEFKDGRIVVSTGHDCCTTTQGFDAPGYNWLDLKIDVHSHPGSDPSALNPRNGTDIGRANHLRNKIPGLQVKVYIPLMPGNKKLFDQ
jgi:RHS repeat-associated protein